VQGLQWLVLLSNNPEHKEAEELRESLSGFKIPGSLGVYQSLLFTAMLEPLIYHPMTVWWGVRGNIDYVRGNTNWGAQERKGFAAKKK
jgi:hypothetical protein